MTETPAFECLLRGTSLCSGDHAVNLPRSLEMPAGIDGALDKPQLYISPDRPLPGALLATNEMSWFRFSIFAC